MNDNDEMINDKQIASQMKFEKLCASGDCSSMPAKQKMQIKVGYTVNPSNVRPHNLGTLLLYGKHCVIHHLVPFTTYNNTLNLRISQSAVQFSSVPKSAECGVLLYG